MKGNIPRLVYLLGVFCGLLTQWPGAVLQWYQHCSQLLHPAAAANLVMMLLSTTLLWNVWHDSFYVLLLQQQICQQSLQVTYLHLLQSR